MGNYQLDAPLASEAISKLSWWRSGTAFIWLNALAIAISVCAVVGLVALLAVKGLGHFWPSQLVEFEYSEGSSSERVIGEVAGREIAEVYAGEEESPRLIERWLIKTGNRRANAPDFRWVERDAISGLRGPTSLAALERTEWGSAYGRVIALHEKGSLLARDDDVWRELDRRIARVRQIRGDALEIESQQIGAINFELERLRLELRRLELEGEGAPLEMQRMERKLQEDYQGLEEQLRRLGADLYRDSIDLEIMNGEVIRVALGDLLRIWQPNAMSWWEKVIHYAAALGRFLTEDPREANTEGGVFPAIFGTVMMVLLMSVVVTPLGVVAAVYLREYSNQGPVVRMTRIAVNNLAGVPSIVYGVFGLGFFVYLIGGTLDDLFYAEAQPAPTFGTPGLLWASLTLALLTLPVVIVSTEEGLARIPKVIREGSLALGATKAETLYRVVLPIASPSILTGVILAVARAAGEVAPLMLVGVVKLAPSLPVDAHFPYVHLERKFMHLGFHIYDVGFQSPNVEAARPLVYATALLLVLIILALNITAILLRNKLERRFGTGEHD